jgi:hypothetical protein
VAEIHGTILTGAAVARRGQDKDLWGAQCKRSAKVPAESEVSEFNHLYHQ